MKTTTYTTIAIACLFACSAPKKMAGLDYGSPNLKQELLDEQTFMISHYSKDKSYGYSMRNPVMVGGDMSGPMNERRFLNALAGPKGEQIFYEREGSCCAFKTTNSEFNNMGLLDRYKVSYRGLKKPLIIYINMYDSDTLRVPVGLKLKADL